MHVKITFVLLLASVCFAIDIGKLYHTAEQREVRGTISPIICPSEGTFVELTFSDCSGEPCEILVHKAYTIEMKFNPAQDHNSLDLHLSYIYGGTETPISVDNIPVAVSQGNTENVQFRWTVMGNNIPNHNKTVGIRVKLAADNVTEYCDIVAASFQQPIKM